MSGPSEDSTGIDGLTSPLKVEVLLNKPTYVLVHGAWGGAWCWEKFTKDLDSRGAQWRTLDLPSSQFDSDPNSDLAVDAMVVAAVANDVEGPVVLVGHSYAGAVITEAAPLVPSLEGLFYIAATVPDIGQSHSDSARLVRVRTEMDNAIHVDGAFLRLELDVAAPALYQECTPELREWAKSQLSIQTLASFRGVRTSPSVDVPSRYVLCQHDHALDASLQELVSKQCNEVIEINSDHSPFLSHSEQLADILVH
jgi:pimeloyl-ACP methyl ester carboxylesterase